LKRILLVSLILMVFITALFAGCMPISRNTASSDSAGEGILNLLGSDPATLDPAILVEANSAEYVLQIFNGLLRLDEKLEPAADIAHDWQISSDGLTYTFNLRRDVKFQKGRQLKAQDVKYSWERAVNPATGSQTAALYLGDIKGVAEVLAGKSNEISGLKIIDDYTMHVTLQSPKSYFLFKMTYPTTFVVDKDNIASGSEWWRNPNGTGPFKLKSWVQNESFTLERNDLFYGDKARLNQVKYQYNTGVSMDLYEMGNIDVTGVGTSYIDKVMDTSGPFYHELSVSPLLDFWYVGFNCAEPPFDDINIRRAFSLAIDKDKMISLIYRNMWQKADGILPPGLPGYNKGVAGLGFDINRAKELIRNSKYGDVTRLPLVVITAYGYGGDASAVLQAMAYQWKQNLGVEVQIRQLEPEKFSYLLKAETDQMFDGSWIADYPHPQDFIDILFHSGTNYNYGNYSNPEVDALIRQANQSGDQLQSFVLYQQAEQKIVDDAACIPVAFGGSYILVKPYVKNYTVNPLGFTDLGKVLVLEH
jgi:oligopeptide transport system substrate-binding protein